MMEEMLRKVKTSVYHTIIGLDFQLQRHRIRKAKMLVELNDYDENLNSILNYGDLVRSKMQEYEL